MAGIAGLIGAGAGPRELAPLLATLRDGPTELARTVEGAGAVLGHVSLGLGAEDGAVMRRGRFLLAAAGYVPALATAAGLGSPERPLAERLLDRIEAEGPEALAGLDGVLAACLVDEGSGEVVLANDRLGLGRLYYRLAAPGLQVSSRPRALDAGGGRIDAAALGQLLQVGYPLGDRTLFPGVRLLPPASYAIWGRGRLLVRRVWEPPPPAAGAPATRADLAAAALALGAALEGAVTRSLDPRLRIALPLSGGLDSRTLLGFASRMAAVDTFSYGHEHSRDLRFGARLARAAGQRHQRVLLRRDYMARHGARGVRLTGGEAPVHAFHILCLNPALAAAPSLVLSGFLGDALTGGHLDWAVAAGRRAAGGRDAWVAAAAAPASEAGARALFERRYQVGLGDEELQGLVRRPHLTEARGAAYEAFLEVYRRGESAAAGADRVDLELRQRRLIAYQLATLGAAGVVRIPFADREVVDTALALPLAARRGQAAYREMIERSLGRLAAIPLTSTGVPLAGPAAVLALRRRLEWCRWRGLPLLSRGLLQPHDYRQYAHYGEWIRNGARGFFAALIGDRDLIGDLVDTDRAADLFKMHLEGRRDAHEPLSALVTLALLRRQMSGAPAPEPLAAVGED